MVQTRFALILFFSMVARKAACRAPFPSMVLLVQQDVGGTFHTELYEGSVLSCYIQSIFQQLGF